MVGDALAEVTRRYPQVEIQAIGGSYVPPVSPTLTVRRWSLDRELEDLHGFDIGIMPMPDTEWTRGKCGFKALLYMACGVPPVCSPVGMTTDIVQDGQNGLLATTTEEWIEKLSLLVENPDAPAPDGRGRPHDRRGEVLADDARAALPGDAPADGRASAAAGGDGASASGRARISAGLRSVRLARQGAPSDVCAAPARRGSGRTGPGRRPGCSSAAVASPAARSVARRSGSLTSASMAPARAGASAGGSSGSSRRRVAN